MSRGVERRVGRWFSLGVAAGVVIVASLVHGESFSLSPTAGDLKPWGKDPFGGPRESVNKPEAGVESRAELQGVIAGPTGVVAIFNHRVVRVGDQVEGEVVIEITPHAVVLQRGAQVRRVVVRSLTVP